MPESADPRKPRLCPALSQHRNTDLPVPEASPRRRAANPPRTRGMPSGSGPGPGEQTWRMRSRPAALACSAALALSGALAGCSTTRRPGPGGHAGRPGRPRPRRRRRPAPARCPPPTGPPTTATRPIPASPRHPRRRAAVHRLAPRPRRGRLRPAPRDRRPGHRGHRGRLGLRAGPGHRPGPLARAPRHAGAAVRLPCGNIDPLGITGTPVYDPATKLVYAVAETTGFRHVLAGISVPGGTRRSAGHPHPGRPPALRPAAGRADAGPGPGLRGVRGAVRRLRALPRLGRGRPGHGAAGR